MTDLLQRAMGMIHRDRLYFFKLCAWCDKPAGDCDHSRELLAQARGRVRDLRRPLFHGWRPYAGPWVHPRPADVGLRWEESERAADLFRLGQLAWVAGPLTRRDSQTAA